MNYFYLFISNATCILFPLIIYIMYETYTENINSKRNFLIFDFILLSSVYLILKFCDVPLLCFLGYNLILILSIYKKNFFAFFVLFFIGAYTFTYIMLFMWVILSFIYLLIYFLLNKLKYNNSFYHVTFLINLLAVIILYFLGYIDNLVLVLGYYLILYIVLIFFLKSLKIIEINLSYKELRRVKQVRDSLFKISHEIKNPIAVCKGYLDMFDVNNLDHAKDYVPILKSEIDRTLNLLQDFLDFNKLKIHKDIMDVNVLIEDIMDNFKLMFNSKGISYNFDIIDDDVYILGDYGRLKQVFINLIKNSIEAMSDTANGVVDVSLSVIDDNVIIKVSDNGSGISDDNMKNLFEPFFTTKSFGTGLGVNLSKEIVEAHNGTIKYDSTMGKGTIVTITIPLMEE